MGEKSRPNGAGNKISAQSFFRSHSGSLRSSKVGHSSSLDHNPMVKKTFSVRVRWPSDRSEGGYSSVSYGKATRYQLQNASINSWKVNYCFERANVFNGLIMSLKN